MISQMAQNAGHELIMALPMTPRAAPPSNEGTEALTPDGRQEGGAFMMNAAVRGWLATELSHRHLLFINALPDPAERVQPGRVATILIDPDLGPEATRKALVVLEHDARVSGSALGWSPNQRRSLLPFWGHGSSILRAAASC